MTPNAWLGLILALMLALAAGAAFAHGDAAWIQDNKDTYWCCGRDDCERVEDAAAVEPIEGGWLVVGTGQFFPEAKRGSYWKDETGRLVGLYDPQRPGIWWCRPAEYRGRTKCLLVGRTGT